MDLQAGGLRGLQQARDTGWESCTQTAPRSSQACHHPFPQPAHPDLFSGLPPVPGTQWAPSGDDLEVEGPEFGLPCHAEGRNYLLFILVALNLAMGLAHCQHPWLGTGRNV